ncbi:MAG: hypothetical protein IT365_27960 [Candidatus Hydrogenedentes bacterium]|nr:hypothetical protein [Candidatus Hydrogenedentota bacterium]
MPQASTYFTDEQRTRIREAVAKAESRTAAEIVPVVASSSGRYDRAEDIVGLLTGLVLMAITWRFYPRHWYESGSWDGPSMSLELPALALAVLVGFLVGAAIASRIGWLRPLFTPRMQMREEVNARARQAFFDDRVHHTKGATGLLIFVSLYERTAVILADEAITKHLGQGTLDDLCAGLVRKLHEGHAAEGLVETILAAGEHLAKTLPREAGDVNELADALILMD